jgi:hypothetical protein
MRSGKGHYSLYIVSIVLEGASGSICKACQKMKIVWLDRNCLYPCMRLNDPTTGRMDIDILHFAYIMLLSTTN